MSITYSLISNGSLSTNLPSYLGFLQVVIFRIKRFHISERVRWVEAGRFVHFSIGKKKGRPITLNEINIIEAAHVYVFFLQ